MLNSSVVDNRTHNTNVTSNYYAANSVRHNSGDSFFVSFVWNDDIAKGLMRVKPYYYYHREYEYVEIIQMVTMLDRIVAELRFIEK